MEIAGSSTELDAGVVWRTSLYGLDKSNDFDEHIGDFLQELILNFIIFYYIRLWFLSSSHFDVYFTEITNPKNLCTN